MTGETEPHYKLSIEQIAGSAREQLLRDGEHPPTLIAEGSRQATITEFESLGSTFQEREHQMMQAGFLLARDADFGMLKQAFFISEAWMSEAPMDKPPTVSPSQDPNRKEILTVSDLTVADFQVRIVVFEMVRDRQGKLTEVKAFASFADPLVNAQSPLLEALLFGFAMGLVRDDNGQ